MMARIPGPGIPFLAWCVPLLVSAICCGSEAGSSEGDGRNFLIAPASIVRPRFTVGGMDYRIRGTYLSMSFDSVRFGGAGFDFTMRRALSGLLGYDMQFGMLFMSTNDLPSPSLVDDDVDGDRVVVEGIGKVKSLFVGFPFGANLEVQAVRRPEFSLIAFGGVTPNFLFGFITPSGYDAGRWDMNFDGRMVTLTTTEDFGTSMIMVLGGVQGGLQAGIPYREFGLAPFLAGRLTGGSAYVSVRSGYEEVDGDSSSFRVPYKVSFSLGMDVIYEPWGLSVGTVFQHVAADRKEDEQSMVMVSAGYLFHKGKSAGK